MRSFVFFRFVLCCLVLGVGLQVGFAQSVTSTSVVAPFIVEQFDVIVIGSEPEGVAAAVAASETGARTLLITQDPRLGGLFVMGQMNSLDLRTQPFLFQRGLFLRWWREVGLGTSFDVLRAEEAFYTMLQDAGVTVLRAFEPIEPLFKDGQLAGVQVRNHVYESTQLIDATAEMDFAAQAGASFTVGFASLGVEERMADTLVFRIEGIDWQALQAGVRARGKSYASVDAHVAWGDFGGYPAAYQAQEEGIRLRGLNLGRQDDGSVLVNALLIYGIDPFDADSIADGFARAEREAPRIIEYLKQELPGFENAYYGGVAEALYIRESRHLNAECQLSVNDVLDNRVTMNDIAAGGYPLDVQTLTPFDNGFVYGTPDIYGVQLCVSVPKNVDNLWVVGKAAGYDPLAASSARVVPFGMAVAEAVGVAAALADARALTPRAFQQQDATIAALRRVLLERDAYLPTVTARTPVGPYDSPYYQDYRLLLSRGLAVGGYNNNPGLDQQMQTLSYVYLLSNVAQRFHNNHDAGPNLVSKYGAQTAPLTSDLALGITVDAACQLGVCVKRSWSALKAAQLAPENFPTDGLFNRGEMYALAARLASITPVAQQNTTGQPTQPVTD